MDLRADGRFAWICWNDEHAEVHKLDADGPGVLDTQSDRLDPDLIDISSLAIARESFPARVYWRSTSGEHSAPLR